jgi:hypothetical protein
MVKLVLPERIELSTRRFIAAKSIFMLPTSRSTMPSLVMTSSELVVELVEPIVDAREAAAVKIQHHGVFRRTRPIVARQAGA